MSAGAARCVAVALLIALASVAHADPGPWAGIEPGPHPVGFRVEYAQDLARPALAEQSTWPRAERRGRYMQVGIWYPARSARGKAMRYWDYALLRGERLLRSSERESGQVESAAIASLGEFLLADDDGAAARRLARGLPMRAVRDATPARGAYPLVVMIHNLDFYALYGELLASHGYVAVAVPRTGTSALEFDFETIDGVETEVRDAEFAVAYAATLPYVDTLNQAAVGHSYGAQSAAAYAVRNPNVKAIVSLDGGIGSVFGADLLSRMPYYRVTSMRQPLLHLWTPLEAGGSLAPLDAWRYAPRTYVEYPRARHIDFLLAGQLDAVLGGIAAPTLGETHGAVDAMARDMAQRVLAFLDQHLKGSTEVAKQGAIADVVTVHRAALPLPPTLEELEALHASGGIDALLASRATTRKQDPDAYGVDMELRVWSLLNDAGDHADALRWAQQFARDVPDAGTARHVEARSLTALGRNDDARRAFEAAIALLPNDPHLSVEQRAQFLEGAKRRLGELPK